VLIGVVFAGFFGMMGSVDGMSVGDVGVVPGLLVIARFVVFGRFPVMCGRLFMMMRGLMMMFRSLMSHGRGAPFRLRLKSNSSQESTRAI
jgi:hypothetical protein